ncbi:MAG: hypothetical protein AAFQ18_11890 [Pseudomonadota bacterium]
MSLRPDGKVTMAALVDQAAIFPRIKSEDWTSAAVRLAKKQIIAAGQETSDLKTIRSVIGGDAFERTLADLTAFQAKQLAKRIHPTVDPDTIVTKAMALGVIKGLLANAHDAGTDEDTPTTSPRQETVETPSGPGDPARKPNPYLGRKAFRVR